MSRMYPHLKKHLAPSREFLARTEARFLAHFRTTFPAHYRGVPGAMYYIVRGFAGVVGVILALSGGAFYADAANVSPTNMLYPLKRSKEAVELTFTPKTKQPELHLKLAERRLEELATLSSDKAQEKLVVSLEREFRNEVSQSMGDVEIENEADEKVIAVIDLELPDEFEDKRKSNTEKDEEEKAKMTLVAPPAPVSVAVSAVTGGGKMQKNENEVGRDEEVKTIDDASRIQFDAEKPEKQIMNPKFCETFANVIRRATPEMRKSIPEKSDIRRKAEKKCGAISRDAFEVNGSQEMKHMNIEIQKKKSPSEEGPKRGR